MHSKDRQKDSGRTGLDIVACEQISAVDYTQVWTKKSEVIENQQMCDAAGQRSPTDHSGDRCQAVENSQVHNAAGQCSPTDHSGDWGQAIDQLVSGVIQLLV